MCMYLGKYPPGSAVTDRQIARTKMKDFIVEALRDVIRINRLAVSSKVNRMGCV